MRESDNNVFAQSTVRYFIDFSHKLPLIVSIRYATEGSTVLDKAVLAHIGSVDFLLKLYATTRSAVTRENLFMVLFDYAATNVTMKTSAGAIDEQLRLTLALLRSLDAPQFLYLMFRQMPTQFVQRIRDHIFANYLDRDEEFKSAFKTLDRSVFVAVLTEFERMAVRYHEVLRVILRVVQF